MRDGQPVLWSQCVVLLTCEASRVMHVVDVFHFAFTWLMHYLFAGAQVQLQGPVPPLCGQ